MPSVPERRTQAERLTYLEAGYERLSERCDEIMELLEGDGSDEGWKRSVRGRLHRILADLATADKLAYAAEMVKEAATAQAAAAQRQKDARGKRLDTWLQITIAVTAIVVAVTSVIGAIAVVVG